jgi:hypothetical protein
MGFTEIAAVALTTAAVSAGSAAYAGEEQRKQANRALGAQPKPPNTAQPDESALGQQDLGRLAAANGRAGTLLAPPLAPMPSLGLGQPNPTAKTTLGAT